MLMCGNVNFFLHRVRVPWARGFGHSVAWLTLSPEGARVGRCVEEAALIWTLETLS